MSTKSEDPKYKYAVALDKDDCLVIRKRGDEDVWDVIASVDNKDKAKDMVDDLNLAQRLRPQIEPGQELVKRS